MLTAYGAIAVTFMMVMYALERRHRLFVLGFALGCLLSSSYGFLSGTWPFGLVEAVWSLIALRRYQATQAGLASAQRSPINPPQPGSGTPGAADDRSGLTAGVERRDSVGEPGEAEAEPGGGDRRG